jgi:2,3,4,5-tetrahydropyridine-2,6-dicarboxylate N-succinyltransferase
VAVATFVEDLDAPPVDAHDTYLRLHLLSHRVLAPHGLSLEGAFGALNNVVWTDLGPCDPDGFEALRLELLAAGHPVRVTSVDKFPRMTDYVVPSGVRDRRCGPGPARRPPRMPVPPSCTRGSSTSTPARSGRR